MVESVGNARRGLRTIVRQATPLVSKEPVAVGIGLLFGFAWQAMRSLPVSSNLGGGLIFTLMWIMPISAGLVSLAYAKARRRDRRASRTAALLAAASCLLGRWFLAILLNALAVVGLFA
ncbi:MAG: hypothetical protein ABI823_14015 [Bryobacteraceae bacterium]